MDKKQEEKLVRAKDEYFRKASEWHGVEYEAIEWAWQACLDANGIGETPEEKPSINDLAKTFETLAFAITDASNKITAAVNAGIERANAEVVNVEAKEWTPREGEIVFARDSSDVEYAWIGAITKSGEIIGRGAAIKVGYAINNNRVKPFNPSSIGKPWSEI